MRRRSWYDASARIESVRLISRGGGFESSARHRHPRTAPRLGECLLFPLIDGPGIGLLVILPPVLFFLSLPLFDVVALIEPVTRANWALGLLYMPIFLPLMISFSLFFGYGLMFLGQLFVTSAMGELDHPSWPEWDSNQISEGLVRWVWAGIIGLAIGGIPATLYWVYCGDIDWFDRIVFADLVILGAGYALVALAAALLHDTLILANPVTVVGAIARIGWDFVMPCVVGGLALMVTAGAFWVTLFGIPAERIAFVALWGFWVLALYLAMVVLRMVGLTYHAHATQLAWFRRLPKWGLPARFGRVYSNS
jgi:hypothetical protein